MADTTIAQRARVAARLREFNRKHGPVPTGYGYPPEFFADLYHAIEAFANTPAGSDWVGHLADLIDPDTVASEYPSFPKE